METIKSYTDLVKYIKTNKKRVLNLGVIWPTDRKYIDAVVEAVEMGLVRPFFFGPEKQMSALITDASEDSFGSDLNDVGFEIVDSATPAEASYKAFKMAKDHACDILLKGDIATRDFVGFIYSENGLASKKDTVVHIGVTQTPRYHKLMFITDAAVNAAPDAAAKLNILDKTASFVSEFGYAKPKAALLAAVEAIYPAIAVTMEEAAIAKMSDRGQIKNVVIDGPLSFDVAINADIAKSKGIINSPVAGDVDIFMPPNMETANGLYKAMVQFVKAESGSIFWGTSVPIATSSTVDSSKNVLNSILLAVHGVGK
jgi:phosphotransacetylase